ncbi:MAG: hypothetical protein MMC33_000559 [Icmadophila ericetorum]|nr:hypothetical protein [Icmadophila ericetorum]
MGQNTLGPGKIGKKIKRGSLTLMVDKLWFITSWTLGVEVAGMYYVWKLANKALTHKLAINRGLETRSRVKNYFAVLELRLLFLRIAALSTSVSFAKQHYLAWTIMAIVGARPSSLGVYGGKVQTKKEGLECLRWSDVAFQPNIKGRFTVIITLRWLKSRRDPRKKNGTASRPAKFLITSTIKAENLHVDQPWLFFITA